MTTPASDSEAYKLIDEHANADARRSLRESYDHHRSFDKDVFEAWAAALIDYYWDNSPDNQS